MYVGLQWVKKSPLRTCGIFSKTFVSFSTKFYVPAYYACLLCPYPQHNFFTALSV